jgi:hypothetical protein
VLQEQLGNYMTRQFSSIEQEIEYYLGKDRLPNLHWKTEIPASWAIVSRPDINLCNKDSHDTTIRQNGIDYRLNNLGYRSDFDYHISELKTKEVILVLGDSDVMGRGVECDERFSAHIQHGTSQVVINLGVPGTSPDGMTRIGVQTMMALGPAVKHVCVYWPIFSAREFVSKNFQSGIYMHSEHVPYTDWWDQIDWVSNNYNYQKNRLMLVNSANSIGAQYHDLIINRYDKTDHVKYNVLPSRDLVLSQLAKESHTAIGNYFLRKINNQPSLYQEMQS